MTTTLDLDFTTGTLDARITFSRASLGTYYGSDGLLKYAAHNLVSQSQDFSAGNWSKTLSSTVTANVATDPLGTTTADRLNHTVAGTAFGGQVFDGNPVLKTVQSVYAKAGTKSWVCFCAISSNTGTQNAYFDLAAGTPGLCGSSYASSGMESVGNGWYRCWAIANNTPNSLCIGIAETNSTRTCTGPGDIYLWGAQLESITTETAPRAYLPTTTAVVHAPRFDFDPVTHVAKGLLIEEARANSARSTQDLSVTANWIKTSSTVTADATTAPDATTTADSLVASASPGYIQQNFSLTTGTTYTQSVYVKRNTSDWMFISAHDGVTSRPAYFNLATGMVGSYTLDAALLAVSMQDVGNGWYRCVMVRVGTSAADPEMMMLGPCDANGSSAVTIGKSVYLWGAQLEGGAFVTSYLPNSSTGSNVTRAADIATMTGTDFSSWYNQAAGTFAVEFDLLSATGTRPILSADNGTTTERILLYASGTDPKVMVTDNSVVQADLDLGTIV